MKEQVFVDKNGEELIVKSRKSAVFFERKADIDKSNSYGEKHKELVCITELRRGYKFTEEEYKRFVAHCQEIGEEGWETFVPKEANSYRNDYDGYYDRDYDNNGSLGVKDGVINIEGPYAQNKIDGENVRLIKFNKPQFESFVYDISK